MSKQPFTVGDWKAEPALNRLSQGDEHVVLRPKVMDLLVYLSDKPGEVVTVNDIIDDVWEGVIVTSQSVYNGVTELRQALGAGGNQLDYIETIPKRGYRLTAPVVIEPGPVEVEPKESIDAPPDTENALAYLPVARSHQTARRFLWPALTAAMAIVIVAVGWLLYRAEFDSETEVPIAQSDYLITDQSIAVLPINNVSDDPELAFFADGIAEEILNNLARYPNLEVASRSSTLAYRGEARDVPAVGAALDVSYLLEGSVRNSGDAIRVTLQLIRAADDEHIWSQIFEQSGDAGFKAQSDVARIATRMMATNLRLDVGALQARKYTHNDEAYRHAVRAGRERQAMLIGSGGDWQSVLDNYNRALEIDPDFINVHLALANAFTGRLGGTIPLDVALSKANYHFAEAEPTLGETGQYPFQVAYKQIALEANYKAALTNLDITASRMPDEPWIPAYRGIIASRLGRSQEAMLHFKRAVALQPGDAGIRLAYGQALVGDQQYEAAIKQYKTGLEIAQAGFNHEKMGSRMSMAYHALGDDEAANKAIDQVIKSDGIGNPSIDGIVALALGQLGRKQEVADIRRKMSAIAERKYVHPDALFMAALADGDIDAAFGYLEQAILERGWILSGMRTKFYPYEILQADPRWADMLALVEEIETAP